MRRHAEQAGVEFLAGKVLNAVQMPDAWYVSVGPDMYNARAVVLAAGVARGKKFAGEAELLGRGVSYCATCDGMLYRGKPVAVVGYTDTARQEAEFLQKIGCSVTYFDRPKQCEIRGDGRVESVTCDGRTIPAEGVFILRPTMAPTELFPGLAVEQGYVTVDRRMATNLPGLFAAGGLHRRSPSGLQGRGRWADRRARVRRPGRRLRSAGKNRAERTTSNLSV